MQGRFRVDMIRREFWLLLEIIGAKYGPLMLALTLFFLVEVGFEVWAHVCYTVNNGYMLIQSLGEGVSTLHGRKIAT